MRRSPVVSTLFVAAACWLAAGPGAVSLQVAAACRHHAMHMTGPASMPSQGPCFCDQMPTGFAVVTAPWVPAPAEFAPAVTLPIVAHRDASPFPPPSSHSVSPEPPPPNAAA
ncbi:MAG TPA: hypothetical protein VFK78_10695 [Gemmatimonadales bacterium]|nr:hypothetical protein [Gemmatimonadales bacterium]